MSGPATAGGRRRGATHMQSTGKVLLWLSLAAWVCAVAEGNSEDGGSTKNTSDSIFSVPAFFVVFREACEAAVILGVCLGFLDKVSGGASKKRDVWLGALAGLMIALVLGVIFIVIFYVLGNNVFSGDAKAIFEGVLTWFASIIITVLAVGMCGMAHYRETWERKLAAQLEAAKAREEAAAAAATAAASDSDSAASARRRSGGRWCSITKSTMFWIPFIAVVREGLETVIFLAGVGATYPLKSIPLAGIAGLIVGLFCGWLLFAVGGKCTMKVFLIFSTVLLLFIAAGLAMYGAHEFQEAGLFGDPEAQPPSPMNDPVWNICDCCSNGSQPWDIFRALFGYTCDPTPWEILIYCLYWVLALTYLSFKMRVLCFSYRKDKSGAAAAGAADGATPDEAMSDDGVTKGAEASAPAQLAALA